MIIIRLIIVESTKKETIKMKLNFQMRIKLDRNAYFFSKGLYFDTKTCYFI